MERKVEEVKQQVLRIYRMNELQDQEAESSINEVQQSHTPKSDVQRLFSQAEQPSQEELEQAVVECDAEFFWDEVQGLPSEAYKTYLAKETIRSQVVEEEQTPRLNQEHGVTKRDGQQTQRAGQQTSEAHNGCVSADAVRRQPQREKPPYQEKQEHSATNRNGQPNQQAERPSVEAHNGYVLPAAFRRQSQSVKPSHKGKEVNCGPANDSTEPIQQAGQSSQESRESGDAAHNIGAPISQTKQSPKKDGHADPNTHEDEEMH